MRICVRTALINTDWGDDMDYKALDQIVAEKGFDCKNPHHNLSEQELMDEIQKERDINLLWQSFMK